MGDKKDQSSFPSESIKKDVAHLSHMGHKHKHHELMGYNFYSTPYDKLHNVFKDVHAEALQAFNKVASQKKIILKLEGEVYNLKYVLYSLKISK